MNDHILAEDFAAYIDGMLSPEKKNELESHFSGCPACLDELLEIADIVSSRDTIPAQFLKRALGDKSKVTKSILHLRLVFEVAAVFVVVVFIGYLFISNNRFWQTPEQQKPAIVLEKNISPADTSFRDGKMAPLPAKQRERADADQRLADSFTSEKRKNVVGDKGAPVAIAGSVQTLAQENKLNEIAAEKPRPATAPAVVGALQMDLAAKDKRVAKEMEKTAADALQPRVRIEGEAVWTDLLNPELLFAWSWFQKGLALELQIDGAGTVTAVVPLGKFDQPLARQAEIEAKKLLFSVSKKKSRRARLIANEKPSI